MKDTTESPNGSRLAVPVSIQILIGVLLLMLALLWHGKYRAYKPAGNGLSVQSVQSIQVSLTPEKQG
ncbi:hypothetical protein [Tellurirhabdus rosea]|uniref:hypothetical protein n=1 Tax=Tellurirhabdus rosea TaxID=2674997 RepID=UPI002257C681|nr:hypothetical protein [Tellurirhabdus rosea]